LVAPEPRGVHAAGNAEDAAIMRAVLATIEELRRDNNPGEPVSR
jgi:hypothetical protein